VFKHVIQRKRKGLDDYLDKLVTKHDLDQAAIVGFTSMFSQNAACFAMARKLKERNPDITVVLGGANCESPMGQEIVKHVPQIDFVFSGPALKSFPEFVHHRLNQNLEACHRIHGVFSKENVALSSDQATLNESTGISVLGEELDIDAGVELDYEPFLDTFEKYFSGEDMKPFLPFETSRGCWWGEHSQCTFCGLNRATIHHRFMSPEKAIEQFESLFKHAPRFSYLGCVDNIMPRSYVREVFPYLDTPPNVIILYELKVPVSERDVQTLSEAGVKMVQPGIEALATSTLKLMRKGATAFQNLLCLMNCLRHGVYPLWNLLVGFPGEEEEVYEKYVHDMPFLTHLPPPIGVQVLRLDRYSPYFVDAQQYGLDLHPSDFYKLVYPFDEEVLRNLAYHFTNHNFDAPYLATMCKWVGRVREKCNLWWTRWYGKDRVLSPRLFFKQKADISVVYDSRSGEVVEHQIDQTTREVLKQLNRPRRIAEVTKDVGYVQGFDPAKQIAFLQDLGLVFEEDERFLSLVLPEEPPPVNAQVLEHFVRFSSLDKV
jgi:ribosomal peptide maturation radical SAM protein 1